MLKGLIFIALAVIVLFVVGAVVMGHGSEVVQCAKYVAGQAQTCATGGK